MEFKLEIIASVIVILAIAFAFFCSLYRRASLPRSLKIISLLFFVTLIIEITAALSYKYFKTNLPIYGAFCPVQLYLISSYFNESISVFKKKNTGIVIGVVVGLIGLVDYFFIESPYKMNIFFLLTESIVVVGFCMYSFYRMMLQDDDLKLVTYSHFWITAIFLFFWTSTFLFWGLYDYMVINLGINELLLYYTLFSINVITYSAFGFLFMYYNKMLETNE